MKPVLQALVVADRVYEDKMTGKKIIAGTFNRVLFGRKSHFEVNAPDGEQRTVIVGGLDGGSPSAYLSLTDFTGHIELTLQFVSLTKNQTIFGTNIQVESDDRLKTVEIVAPLPRLPITEPGVFAIEVICSGELIGSHRIVAEEVQLNLGEQNERP